MSKSSIHDIRDKAVTMNDIDMIILQNTLILWQAMKNELQATLMITLDDLQSPFSFF